MAASLLDDASAGAILRAIASQRLELATQLEALGAGTNFAGLGRVNQVEGHETKRDC